MLTTIGYIVVILVRVKLKPELAPHVSENVSTAEKLAALKETWPVLLIMVGIFGGMFGGIFTATEAGAIGAFLAVLVALIKRSLTWENFRNAILETLLTTGSLLIIAIGASLLTRFLGLYGAGAYLSETLIGITSNPAYIMVGIVLIYLLLGMFLEPIGAMLLTLPIVLPLVDSAGFSLLWFGVVLTKLLEIGMITPPIGMNVFVIKGVVGKLVSTTAIFRGIAWFLVMDLVVLVALIVFPSIIMALPEMVG